jgi:DNA-directed RNA polymerase subunit RPC12/RpoP
MEVTFELRDSDREATAEFVRANDRLAWIFGRDRDRWVGVTLAVGAVGCLLWYVRDLLVRARADGFSGREIAFMIAPVALLPALVWLSVWLSHRKPARKTGEIRDPHHDDGPRTAIIADEGFVLQTAGGRQMRSWEAGIDSVAETDGHIFVYFSEYWPSPVPKRAFANPASASAFAMEARRRLSAANGPACARALREFVAAQDARCPRCSYSLKGLVGTRCPECGLRVMLSDLVEPKRKSWFG